MLFSLVGYKGDRPAFQSLSHISLWDGKNHFDHPPRMQGTPEKLNLSLSIKSNKSCFLGSILLLKRNWVFSENYPNLSLGLVLKCYW